MSSAAAVVAGLESVTPILTRKRKSEETT